jgi:hypothetical protein
MEPTAVTHSPSGIQEGWVYYVHKYIVDCHLPSVVPLLPLRGWRSTQAQQPLRARACVFALFFWGCVDSVTAEFYGLMMYLHYVLVLNSIYNNYLISVCLSILCWCMTLRLLLINVLLVLKPVWFTSMYHGIVFFFCVCARARAVSLFMPSMYS